MFNFRNVNCGPYTVQEGSQQLNCNSFSLKKRLWTNQEYWLSKRDKYTVEFEVWCHDELVPFSLLLFRLLITTQCHFTYSCQKSRNVSYIHAYFDFIYSKTMGDRFWGEFHIKRGLPEPVISINHMSWSLSYNPERSVLTYLQRTRVSYKQKRKRWPHFNGDVPKTDNTKEQWLPKRMKLPVISSRSPLLYKLVQVVSTCLSHILHE